MEPDEERRQAEENRRVAREIQHSCWESIKQSACKIFCFLFIVVLFIASLSGTIAFYDLYPENSKELERLKSTEKEFLRATDITKETKKWNLDRLAKKIEDEEYLEYVHFVSYTVCLSAALAILAIPSLVCFAHGVSEIFKHIDNTDDCWEMCPFLKWLSACTNTRRNSANRTASDSRVTYSRAAPENVVFPRTRNIEEGVVQGTSEGIRTRDREVSVVQETSAERRIRNREEGVVQETSENLPGVPSTSNN